MANINMYLMNTQIYEFLSIALQRLVEIKQRTLKTTKLIRYPVKELNLLI